MQTNSVAEWRFRSRTPQLAEVAGLGQVCFSRKELPEVTG